VGDFFQFGGRHPKDCFDILRRLLPDLGKTGLRRYVTRESIHRTIEDHAFEALRRDTGFGILGDVAETHAHIDDLPRSKSTRSGVGLFDEAVFGQLAKVK